MRLEQLPIILGVLIALIGLTIALDAWQAGGVAPLRERRRRARALPTRPVRRSSPSELCAWQRRLMGRDTWRWGTIAVLAGSALLIARRAHE